MYLGELAALGTAVMWSLTAIFFSYSGRIMGAGVVNRSRLLFAFLFLLITHYFLEGSLFPLHVEGFRWFWFAVSSILGLVLGDAFLYKAYVMIGPRLSMLLMSTVPIYSTILGWLLFDETMTRLELSGVVLAVAGIGWVITEKQPGLTVVEHKHYKEGVFFGLLGALGQVTNLVTARYGLVGGFSSVSATIIRILVAIVVLWGITAVRGQIGATVHKLQHRKALTALVGGAFVGPFLGIWLSLIAIQLTRLGIASTLMALPPIMLIPIEYLVYKKPVSLRGIGGTVIALAGVALIFLPQ